MATLYRRENGTYYANYVMGGRRLRRSFRTRDPRLARIALGELAAKMERGRLGLGTPDITVGRFLERYRQYSDLHKGPRTCRQDGVILRRFFQGAGRTRLGALTAQDVDDYQRLRLAAVSLATVHREMQLIRAAFRWAVKMGCLGEDPCRKVQKLRQEKRLVERLRPDELERVLRAAGEPVPCVGRGGKGRGQTRPRRTPLGPMVAVAAFAGLRLGEILHLHWEDVDLEGACLAVRCRGDFRPKDREERRVPLCQRLIAILRQHREATGRLAGPVFTGTQGQPLARRNALRELSRLARRLGLRCHWQILRHSFASHLVAGGVSIFKVSKFLGHASVTTTEAFYAHLAPNEHGAELDRVFG